ncbi:MAG: DNA polymerase III subunit delta [Planctomycetes bacterium]|nr:DNA polymerase III subunit delta [Planctomycetota bacterium]
MSAGATNVRLVYAIVGPDRFLRGESLKRVLAQLGEEVDACTRLEGSDAVLAEVLDEVRTMSLLGTRRVVVVEEADPFITRHREVLERYVADPCPSGCLILSSSSLPRNTRLYKAVNAIKGVIHCDPPKGRAMIGWIASRAEATYRKRISPAAAQRLREHLGDNPGVLDAELAKLASFVGDRTEIGPADIDALTGHHREEKVFAVTDAMSAGEAESALRHWEQVLATDRAAPGRAIAGLAWGVRRLLAARREWEQGADLQGIARRMYADADTLRRRLERVSTAQLEEQQHDLLAADLAVKTGASTIDVAVERFIVKHSTR